VKAHLNCLLSGRSMICCASNRGYALRHRATVQCGFSEHYRSQHKNLGLSRSAIHLRLRSSSPKVSRGTSRLSQRLLEESQPGFTQITMAVCVLVLPLGSCSPSAKPQICRPSCGTASSHICTDLCITLATETCPLANSPTGGKGCGMIFGRFSLSTVIEPQLRWSGWRA
jgi:hypothetical protein